MNQKFETYRQAQMRQLGFWVAGPIAAILVLQAIYIDQRLYPIFWNTTWIWLRLGIIPVSIIGALFIRGRRFGGLWADLGVYLVAVYIALIHAYFVSMTGFDKSKYFNAYIQILMGGAIIPLAQGPFLVLMITILGIYIGTVARSGIGMGEFLTHGDGLFLDIYIFMIILLYYAVRASRQAGYKAQIALESELVNRESEIQRLVFEKLQTKQNEALIGLARQVAHDIRSPLSALQMIGVDLPGLSEERRTVLQSAVTRINMIANDLLDRSRGTPKSNLLDERSVHLVSVLLGDIIMEKQIQYSGHANISIELLIEDLSYGAFASIEPSEFKRILSNLIDNSVEAIRGTGRIEARLLSTHSQLIIEVKDNGKGIMPEILPKLMQRGASFGKDSGSGLGLFHAKKTVDSWNGNIVIESTVGKGTRIVLELPIQSAPNWFVPFILLKPSSTIVILDDDLSIHELWSQRLRKFEEDLSLKVLHFFKADELRKWVKVHTFLNALFLIDFELTGQKTNGLSLIEEMSLQNQSILVTNRYEELDIRSHCERLGISLLPKLLAATVPLQLANRYNSYQP